MKIVVVVHDKGELRKIENMLQSMTTSSDGKGNVCGEGCYEVVGTAGDGKAGYELIRRECPDLVIADIDLPEMSGLEMLEKISDESQDSSQDEHFCGNQSRWKDRRYIKDMKAVLLAWKEDFGQAKRAIDLGVEGYLLKPVSEDELRQVVMRTAEKVMREHAADAVLSIENILMACMNGQLTPDPEFHMMTMQRFGFTVEEPGAVFAVWLGDGYEENKEQGKNVIGQSEAFRAGRASRVFEARAWNILLVVLYHMEDEEQEYTYFQKEIVPKLCQELPGTVVCIWAKADHIINLMDVLKHMNAMKDWNLLFDRGELIRQEVIDGQETVPLKYPAEIELQVRQAMIAKDGEGIKRAYYRFYDQIRREPHSPGEMKECLIRFNMSLLNVYKTQREIESELEIQRCMLDISNAMSWREVRAATDHFLQMLNFDAFEEEKDSRLSPLVRKAVQIVRKYYDQGITLEEVADRLFVSEEYLSSQFKKETGAGFAETIRKYRIERIKGLLIGTELKLNQIAELTGYKDAKYMSRVFKEETGMLPTEFRKAAH